LYTRIVLSIAGAGLFFFWQGYKGFSLMDEGAFWYGAQRVLLGEVPIRDFMSYDIGRYYWSAAFMNILDDNGIVALRVGSSVFQAIALFTGLTVLIRNSANQNVLFWILVIITLLVWGVPQFRLIDISLPIITVGALSFLVENPSRRRYFVTGLIVGFVAVFGRNHGMYAVAGSLGIIFYLTFKRDGEPGLVNAFTNWLFGVIVGYLPILVFLAVVPGFALAFWEHFPYLFANQASPLPLPVPWPWQVAFGELPTFVSMRYVLIGVLFIFIVVYGLLGITWVIRSRLLKKPVSPVVVATAFIALPYSHYAYSRADMEHLALGIPPLIMGIFALLANQSGWIKWSFATLLCGVSIFMLLPNHPGYYCKLDHLCVEAKVAEDSMLIDIDTAGNLAGILQFAEQFAPDDRTFLVAPSVPGIYAALGRKAPMWEIYALFPRNLAFQQSEIERIKAAKPGFALIINLPFDDREDLRFSKTHPLVYKYILDNYERWNTDLFVERKSSTN